MERDYLNTNIKLGLFHASVYSAQLYGSTTWKIINIVTRKLQTFINSIQAEVVVYRSDTKERRNFIAGYAMEWKCDGT